MFRLNLAKYKHNKQLIQTYSICKKLYESCSKQIQFYPLQSALIINCTAPVICMCLRLMGAKHKKWKVILGSETLCPLTYIFVVPDPGPTPQDHHICNCHIPAHHIHAAHKFNQRSYICSSILIKLRSKILWR